MADRPFLALPGMRLLADHIKDKGMTLESFGGAVGVSDVTVHRWIKGKARPSYEKACEISRVTDGKIGVAAFYPDAEVAA